MKAFDPVRDQIVNFYDFEDAEREAIIQKVIAVLAAGDQQTLIQEIRADFPQQVDSRIGVIYEAISHDPDRWADFMVEEFERAFKAAKTAPNPSEILESLEELAFVKNPKPELERRIVKIIEGHLNSDDPLMRRDAISLIGGWVGADNKNRYPTVVANVLELLHDENWKVRHASELMLMDIDALPEGYSRSILDKLRVYFGNPYK